MFLILHVNGFQYYLFQAGLLDCEASCKVPHSFFHVDCLHLYCAICFLKMVYFSILSSNDLYFF